MDKIKTYFNAVVSWYKGLTPNWQRAIQVVAALILGFVSGKVS